MVKIEKTKVAVTIYTATHRVDGTYFTIPGTRFIDDLNARQKQFIPLRDATITPSHDGVERQSRCDFIAVSVRSIMFFCPNPRAIDATRRVLQIEPRAGTLATR